VKKVELEVVSLSPENLLTLRRKDGSIHPHRVLLEEDDDETSHSARARQMLKAGKAVIVQVMQTMGREKVCSIKINDQNSMLILYLIRW